jgi:WD40 repeat protein
MAQVRRHCRTIAAALLALVGFAFAPVLADGTASNAGTDLYDRPVLAVDPGMHTARIASQAVDASGRFAVTGSDDHTVRVWSVADGKLLQTIWVPVGPENVGRIYAVAISPDGSTIAAGGWTENRDGLSPIYLFDRDSGKLSRRISDDLLDITNFITFSPDGRYLAASLGGGAGLRIFDRDKDWGEAFRDDQYGDLSYGAAFTRDGRLAVTSFDGMIRFYNYDPHQGSPNFRRVGEPVKAPSGDRPLGVAFSPDDKLVAIGYHDVAAVDVLDGTMFKRVGGRSPADVTASPDGLANVAWSADGRTLFAIGSINDSQGRRLLFAWIQKGLGHERRMTYCVQNTAAGVNALPEGRVLVASTLCLGLMDARGEPLWTVTSATLDFREQSDVMRVSQNGQIVDFGYRGLHKPGLRFDVRSLTLSGSPPDDGLTFTPNREGLAIDGWLDDRNPTLNGQALPFQQYDLARSLAVATDAKRFFLGSSWALAAFDDAGTQKWRWQSRNEVWAVNASKDGRVVVTADGDGAIHWHRADDGRELLTLQVLPNGKEPAMWDWVLWTPEGFYEATRGAQEVLKWVTNHGPDNAATAVSVSAVSRLHRPDALRFVIDELNIKAALGAADLAAARLAVQAVTGSAKPPGAVLHVLAIGVNQFGLKFAADDARSVADTLSDSQKIAVGKASLYAGVTSETLVDEKAGRIAILEAVDDLVRSMRKSVDDQDVAVILFSGHGEMIENKYYLIPYGVDTSTPTKMETSSVWIEEFAGKIKFLAERGRVLLLFDACHSGAVGPGGESPVLDAGVLRDALNSNNIAILTSSDKDELSREDPTWKHGAFTKAFLDALAGGADPSNRGLISVGTLADAMKKEVKELSGQRLGMRMNFAEDVFVTGQ